MIAALSRVVLTGGSRVLPSVDLAPDADPRSRLPRALTLLAAVEIPLVLAGAVGQALPLGYRDVVALVVIFAIAVAMLTLVPWRRIGEGWLLVPVGAHIVFVATLVALTGGGSSPFFVLYAPMLALAGWTLRGPDLVLVIGSVASTEVWRALAVARGESVDTLTIGLPVFVLLALLAYGTSGRLAAASALLRLDAVTSAGALETVRRIEEGHADPYEQLAMEMGRLFRARSSVLPLTDAAALRSYAATTDGGYLRVPIVGDARTHGLLQLWRTRDFTPTEVRLAEIVTQAAGGAIERRERAGGASVAG